MKQKKPQIPKEITPSQLIQILQKTHGAAPVRITAVTDTRARKNPYGHIYKHSKIVGFVGTNYTKSVRREGKRQGVEKEAAKFKAEELPWGHFIPGLENKLLVHNDQYYLRISLTPGQKKAAKLQGFYDEKGAPLDFEAIKEFLPEKHLSAKQAAAGLRDDVLVRNYSLDNIVALTIGGKKYILKR